MLLVDRGGRARRTYQGGVAQGLAARACWCCLARQGPEQRGLAGHPPVSNVCGRERVCMCVCVCLSVGVCLCVCACVHRSTHGATAVPSPDPKSFFCEVGAPDSYATNLKLYSNATTPQAGLHKYGGSPIRHLPSRYCAPYHQYGYIVSLVAVQVLIVSGTQGPAPAFQPPQ